MEAYLPLILILVIAPMTVYLQQKPLRFRAYWTISGSLVLFLTVLFTFPTAWEQHLYMPVFLLMAGAGQLYRSTKTS